MNEKVTKMNQGKEQIPAKRVSGKDVHVVRDGGQWVVKGAGDIVGAIIRPSGSAREVATEIKKRRSDKDALRSDWEAIGGDMRVAIEKFKKETGAN